MNVTIKVNFVIKGAEYGIECGTPAQAISLAKSLAPVVDTDSTVLATLDFPTEETINEFTGEVEEHTSRIALAVENLFPATPLESLWLSVRAYNVARRAGCRNAGDLFTHYHDWKGGLWRNAGRRTIKEYEELLHFYQP